MKITDHNVETGEVIERDASKDEIAQSVKDQADFNAKLAEAETKARAKAAAQAKLAALGLTIDDLKALGL